MWYNQEENGKLTDMIRKLQKTDINTVSHIWLNTNLKAHFFIPEQYWISNYEFVKEMLPQSEVYVYENNNKIQGFIGVKDDYIEGIFVADEMQSHGIGKKLLDYIKNKKAKLQLNVYQKMSGQYRFTKEKDSLFKVSSWMN